MDPHNDVKSDVDYQAVLSHMNIHKGKQYLSFPPIDFYGIDCLDKILHNNEAALNQSHTTVRGSMNDENDQDRVSIGCNSSCFLSRDNHCHYLPFSSALDFRTAVKTVRKNFPVSSYSSSDDDDDFYDADETIG